MNNYRKEQWHRHLGVYGICVNSKNQMLVVKKNGGPYTGFYDLPGGSLENPESLTEGLKREILEETGYSITIEENFGSFDFLINSSYNGYDYTHHIALMYRIGIEKKVHENIEQYVINNSKNDENDSLGFEWINVEKININNASPLVLKACKLLHASNIEFDIEEYIDWVK